MKKYKKYINNTGYEFVPYSNNPQYAMGGMYQGQPNAEIEGGGNGTAGEVVNYPDGTTDQAFGETHEKGGVEVNLPEATRIFSNRIKIGKRTIAKVAQRYKTNREEAILKDTTSSSLQKKTAELNMSVKNKILDKIFNIQEFIKSKKINRYIKRYGGTQMYAEGGQSDYDSYAAGANMAVNAGIATNAAIELNDTSNKNYRKEDNKDLSGQIGAAGVGAASGAVTGASIGASAAGATLGLSIPVGAFIGGVIGGTSNFFKQRSNDKKEWKAEQEQENQQMIAQQNAAMYAPQQLQQPQMYPHGGTHNPYYTLNSNNNTQIPLNLQSETPEDQMNSYYDNIRRDVPLLTPNSGLGSSPDLTFDQVFKNTLSHNSKQVMNYARNSSGLLPGSTKPYQDPRMYPNTTEPESSIGKKDSNPNFYSNNKEMLGKAGTELGLGLLQNAGNLAYLAQNGRDYDKVNYGSVTPELPTDRDSQREIREAYSTAAYNLRNSGQQTQAGLVGLAGEKMKAAAGSRERIGNIIADIRNRTNMFNKETQIRGMEAEAGNKGVAESNYYTALNSIGQNVASQRGDYLSGQMDQKKLNLILKYFPDYELDPKTFQYMFRNAEKQSKIEKP